MRSLKVFNQRAWCMLGAAAMLVLATFVPAIVSAAQVTERSVEMSSSTKGATGVSYTVNFTAETDNTGAFVLDVCDDALVGTACTTAGGAAGFDTTAGIAVGSNGDPATVTQVDANTAKVVLDTPVDTDGTVTVELTGLTNPSAADVFYARIVTYQDGTTNYNYTDAETLGAYLDEGTVALSTTDGFGVSGTVEETMTFCVSGPNDGGTNPIGTDCSGTLESPDIALGDEDGVLSTSQSTGTIYSQISTNAAGGAVVNLKSDATGCGGLLREGSGTVADRCSIAPITTPSSVSTISDAQFGLKLASLDAATGTVAASGSYNTTHFFMNYVDGDATGVTSPYGDPVYNTDSEPVDDGTANLTFGAAIDSTTPAGKYSADFSLVATGKF